MCHVTWSAGRSGASRKQDWAMAKPQLCVKITLKKSVTLKHRPGNVLQNGPHRVSHSGVEFAVLTGMLDEVLVKDNTTRFENHDRG